MGSEWSSSIASHIDNCKVCLAFHSKASRDSKHCRREINYAVDIDKEILSVFIEEVKFDSGMKMQLSSYQSTFWYQYHDKEEFFTRLIEKTPILEPCRAINDIEKKKSITDEKEKTDSDIKLPPEIQYYMKTADAYDAYGRKMKKTRQYRSAREFYTKSVELREKIVAETGTPDAYYSLALSYYALSLVDPSDIDIAPMKKAERILKDLVEKYPEISELRDDFDMVSREVRRMKRIGRRRILVLSLGAVGAIIVSMTIYSGATYLLILLPLLAIATVLGVILDE